MRGFGKHNTGAECDSCGLTPAIPLLRSLYLCG